MSNTKRFWEKGYSDYNVWTMGGPSLEVFELEKLLPRCSTVLDIGCGDGRNSVFLALQGHKVTALELSSNAVKKLRLLSEQCSLNIEVIESYIEDFKPNQIYDLVLAHSSLHFVEKKIWKPLVKKLRDLTKDGGFHNFTSFISTPRFPIPQECRHANSFDRGDLDSIYTDWQIIRSDFYAKWDSHPGIPTHVHVVEKFVARKIKRNSNLPFLRIEPANSKSLSEDVFENIPLNISSSDVRKLGVLTRDVYRTAIPSINLLAIEAEEYIIEDWFFDKQGLQFTNEILTGKYLYFTKPFYLVVPE